MLQVRKSLCLGCGLCAQSCPRGAITFPRGVAEIDPGRCDCCHLCLQVCPQGAIAAVVRIAGEDLRESVATLKQQADDLLARIGSLKR